MPVLATPTTPLIVTLDDVRGFMRDVAGQVPGTGVENIMFDLPEFSDADIARAQKFTVARYNVVAPISNDSADGINSWILLVGVCEFLMRSEAFRQLRNEVPLQDGDVQSPGLDAKAQQYVVLADSMRTEFMQLTKDFKITRNLDAAFGSLGSGYRSVSRFMHSS